MTLPDFLEFEPLNQLRRLMNAPLLQNFTPEHTMKPLTYADLDKCPTQNRIDRIRHAPLA